MGELLTRNARKRKIAPLNYIEAACAPALKGMTSFLDLKPEDIRSGHFANLAKTTQTTPLIGLVPPLVSLVHTYPGDETSSGYVWSEVAPNYAGDEAHPGDETLPGRYRDETSHSSATTARTSAWLLSSSTADGLKPGCGRSKVRKCVLAQDGHSLGEEAIYQLLWRTGKSESLDPNDSRTNRIGAAEISFKVNMAKKNVRQNLSRLFEKLAFEIIENFDTMNSRARLYRVFSYKQILERRRAAGMLYVVRNKGVVFCNADGTEQYSTPGVVSSPGVETDIRPAPSKKRKKSSALVRPSANSKGESMSDADGTDSEDVKTVASALNRYWTVDEAAARQLLRDCRHVRADANADEIAFFVREKLEMARSNRNIINPTGLILATVPQLFAGSSFDEFRRRLEYQASLVADEEERRQQQQRELEIWLAQERDHFESIVSDLSLGQEERDHAEKRLRQAAMWNH
jgi:hypothetical protein